MTITKTEFRGAVGRFASGVTVVTTTTQDNRWVGFTASSFCSLSLEPPLILVALARTAACYEDFEASKRFAVNVLAAGDDHLALAFATKQEDKFRGNPRWVARSRAPVLDGAHIALICVSAGWHEGGDHRILIGEVVDILAGTGEPLLYHGGRFISAPESQSPLLARGAAGSAQEYGR